MREHVSDRARFDLIRYANVWEDTEILLDALRPRPGKRILSIASGGDNAIALAAGGAEVIAADLSPAQLACCELKLGAIRQLQLGELHAFLGIDENHDRLATFEAIAGELTEATTDFFRTNREIIRKGVIHAGKFEKYFHFFRRWIIPLIHSRRTIDELLAVKSTDERADFYDRVWDSRRWRMLFRVFFSRFVMGRMGRDPEFFRYVQGSVADRILERTKYALTQLPTNENRYLEYILRGNYCQTLPWYLMPEHFAAVRDGVSRITLHQGTIEEAAKQHAAGGFDGFNLSDLFEYLDESICETNYRSLLEVSNPRARFAYWNMLVPRRCPRSLADRVTLRTDVSNELYARDQAFFYSAFVVEDVNA